MGRDFFQETPSGERLLEHRGLLLDSRHPNARGAARLSGKLAGVIAALQTAEMNLLRSPGFRSVRAGMQSVMHDLQVLLSMT